MSFVSQRRSSILVSAGKVATDWSERGIALGGVFCQVLLFCTHPDITVVIVFVTLLHGFTPRIGVYIMNVRICWPCFRPLHSFSQHNISVAVDLQDLDSYLCCDNGLGSVIGQNPH